MATGLSRRQVLGVVAAGLAQLLVLCGMFLWAYWSVGGSLTGGESINGEVISVSVNGQDTHVCVRDARKQLCALVPSIPEFTRVEPGRDCAYLRKRADVTFEPRPCHQLPPPPSTAGR